MRTIFRAFLMLLAAAPAAAQLPVPAGLQPGDTYQLVFNSSTFRNGASSNISAYNNHVQAAANAAGIGDTLGITWSAIASTASINARANAVVGANTPVYNMRAAGIQKVADGRSDMWDGTLDALLRYDEFGQLNERDAWTGSNSDGTRFNNLTLGHAGGNAVCGSPRNTDNRWTTFLAPSTDTLLSVYALSEIITVTDADFDQNGVVSGGDFLRWQSGVGSSGTLATGDANGDQSVDGDDLEIWEKSYGQGVPAAAVAASVPEPSGVLLLLVAVATTSSRIARRR